MKIMKMMKIKGNNMKFLRSLKAALWYKTAEFDWIDAKEYYVKMTQNCEITVLKVEYFD